MTKQIAAAHNTLYHTLAYFHADGAVAVVVMVILHDVHLLFLYDLPHSEIVYVNDSVDLLSSLALIHYSMTMMMPELTMMDSLMAAAVADDTAIDYLAEYDDEIGNELAVSIYYYNRGDDGTCLAWSRSS